MRTILNLIWLIFGGLWLALGYVFFGILACILIVTSPLACGIASAALMTRFMMIC